MIRLFRTHLLRPYRGVLAAVVVLQAVQALASLYLPTLNADIVDKGILRGDDACIRSVGLAMLGVTLVQVAFSVAAVYCSARAAMSFGRDVRGDLFHRVHRIAKACQEVEPARADRGIRVIDRDLVEEGVDRATQGRQSGHGGSEVFIGHREDPGFDIRIHAPVDAADTLH